MAKNVLIGMGSSCLTDAYQAAKEAANLAINQLHGKPSFSIVLANSILDPVQIAAGINEMFGTAWVGCSVDRQISSEFNYSKDTSISILSIKSDYLHFGVGYAEEYKKSPKPAGSSAIQMAMADVKADRYVDSYIQFTRTKKQDYSTIVRTPPYFIFMLVSSQTKKEGSYISGEESQFLEGVLNHTGPHVPVFGIGSGSDFDAFLNPEVKNASNYQFAQGKAMRDAGIAVFAVSDVHFEIDVKHGYSTTKDYVVITKLDSTGFDIQELNGKEPVEEYCRLMGINKEEYLKSPEKYSLMRPLGVVALDNTTYIKESFPNPDGKTLHCTYKLKENMVMNILQFNKESMFNTMTEIIQESKNNNPSDEIALALFCKCCSRRLLMDGHEDHSHQILKDKYPSLPYFGCYAFSEIGSTKNNMAQVHGETVTSLVIYDKLLTEG